MRSMSQCFNIVYLAVGFTAGQLPVLNGQTTCALWVSVYTKWPAKAAVGTNAKCHDARYSAALGDKRTWRARPILVAIDPGCVKTLRRAARPADLSGRSLGAPLTSRCGLGARKVPRAPTPRPPHPARIRRPTSRT